MVYMKSAAFVLRFIFLIIKKKIIQFIKVKTVNVNSEGFKRNFSGAQPPIMVEEEK